MWLQTLSFLCLVVGLFGQCCPPLQYEVTEDIFAGQKKGPDMFVTRGMQRVAYDAKNKRLAVHGVDYTKNIVSAVIMDYKQGKEYIWSGGNCKVVPASAFNESCVPIGAKHLGKSVMGREPHTIPVDQFSFEKGNNTYYASLGPDCTPVEGHFAGTFPNEEGGYAEFIVYSNFSLGIQDESVFTPPDFCKTQTMSHGVGKRRRRALFYS